MKLPNGWSKSRLGDVVESRVEQGLPEGAREFTYVDISAVDNQLKEIVTPKTIVATKAPSRARQRIQKDDVLVSTTRPNLNAVALVPPSLDGAIASTGFAVLRPILLDPRWVFSVVQSDDFVNQLTALVKGALYPAVRPGDVHDYVMAVPPLAEQRRITSKLCRLLKRLATVRAALNELPELIRQYRAAVLEAACTGRLVPTEAELARKEHRDFQPASVLLQRILHERRAEWERQELARMRAANKKPKDAGWRNRYREPQPLASVPDRQLPNGWCWARVDQCGVVQLGRQRSPEHHKGKNLRPYLRVANVFEDRIDLRDVKRMNFTPEEFAVFRLLPNDILLNEGQTLDLVGRPAIYRGEIEGACFQNTLVRFRPLQSLVPEYALAVFRHYLHSKRFRQIGKIVTNLAHLGTGRFADLEFPLPPLMEQRRIVRELQRRLAALGRTEKQVSAAGEQTAQLRASTFNCALSGKLVAQRNSDEPAKELLARIRVGREQRLKKQKRTKPRRKAKMKKLSPEDVKEAIARLPKDRFTFEELSTALQADYDPLKDIIFDLLGESKPTLKQVFDSRAKTMRFERITS
jgi:type I restriction enzyme S subunit